MEHQKQADDDRTSRPLAAPWLTQSGTCILETKPLIVVVAENEQRSSLLCRWLSTRFDCQQKTIEAAWADLAQGQRCDLVMISLEAKDSALSPLQLMERIASCGRRIPVVAIVSDLCLLPSPEAALFTDFIATPLTEGGVVQRAQLVLSLQESEARNTAYKKHYQANLAEMSRLRRMAYEKELRATEAVRALEAPIVTVTQALVKVLAEPELENSHVRASLESILNLMTKDVYRPALERVLQSELDPVAMSLLQSYFNEESQNGQTTPPRKLSRKQSRSMGEDSREDELIAWLESWDFNVFCVEQEVLVTMVCMMYRTYQPEEMEFDPQVLNRFVTTVANSYHKKPYHSFRHAFDVTQTLFFLLGRIQASDSQPFTNLEICAMLTASLCHDVAHPGRTNKFLVATGDKLALTYNDRSVLEQMHCSKAFAILQRPGCNIFASLSKPVYVQLRQYVIACILSTDMGEHFSLQSKVETVGAASQLSSLDRMAILVHACDISNVAKPWGIAYEWSKLVTAEFFEQGDAEKEMQMPVEPYMDRTRSTIEKNTANFITFVCRKWFVSVAKIFPCMMFMVQQMEDNLAKLEQLAKDEAIQKP